MIEVFGILASIIIAISYALSGDKLRIVGAVGAAMLSIYGIIIESYPVAGLNLFIVFINLYKVFWKKK